MSRELTDSIAIGSLATSDKLFVWTTDDDLKYASVSTVGNRLALVSDAAWHGAVGDGATDNTTALRAWLKAASDVGGIARISVPGTYRTGTLTAAGSVQVELSDGVTIKAITGATGQLFNTAIGCQRLIVRGGSWDGDGTAAASGALLYFDRPAHVEVATTIRNTKSTALQVMNATSGSINAVVRNADLNAVVTIDCSDMDIYADVDTCGGSGVLVKATTRDSERMVVEGTFRDCAQVTTVAAAVYFNTHDDSYYVRHSTVRNVRIYDAGWVGVLVTGPYNRIENVTVDGAGQVTAVTGHGIWVHDSDNVVVSGCVSRRAKRSGFLCNKSRGVTFVGCVAERNDHHGFLTAYDATATPRLNGDATNKHVVYAGCLANDNGQASANTYSGFYVDGTRETSLIGCQAHDYQSTKTQRHGVAAPTNADTRNLEITGGDYSDNRTSAFSIASSAYLRSSITKGGIGVATTASATTPGSVVRKMQVFDASGASLGFVPIYDAIT